MKEWEIVKMRERALVAAKITLAAALVVAKTAPAAAVQVATTIPVAGVVALMILVAVGVMVKGEDKNGEKEIIVKVVEKSVFVLVQEYLSLLTFRLRGDPEMVS